MPLKTDSGAAPAYDGRRQGGYVRAGGADFRTDVPVEIFPEDAGFPVLPAKHVFADKDGSTGILYPATGGTALAYRQIAAGYRKPRNAECYHKSLKQNASPEKPPAKTVTDQTNFSASQCGYVKAEMFRFSDKLNHYAPKAEIYITALQSAFSELQKLQLMKLSV